MSIIKNHNVRMDTTSIINNTVGFTSNTTNNEPVIESVNLSDIFIRSMYFNDIGNTNIPHKHNYDHYTLLAAGSCIGIIDSIETKYISPAIIFTPAHVLHYFKALEKNTALHCINVLKNYEPLIVNKNKGD